MRGLHLILALGVATVAYGYPMVSSGKSLVTGVFIPSEAFQNLEDRANANSPNNQQPMQEGQSNQQPNYKQVNTNQPQYQQYQQRNPPATTNQQDVPNNQPRLNRPMSNIQQPISNIQQPMSNVQQPMSNIQQPMTNIQQPTSNNGQSVVYPQQQLTQNREPNQPIVVMTNQPNAQSTRPNIVYVQQPSSSQPVYVQQPSSSQPVYVQQPSQGNQGYILPNSQPTQVIIASNPPNGNQIQGTLVQSPNQNQPGSTVYTLIPLNSQNNVNSNTGGSYLIPVQSGNSNPIILSTGK